MLERMTSFPKKLASWLGDKTQFGVASHQTNVPHLNEIFNYQSINNLLHYDGYDPQTELFSNKHSQGFVLEAYPLLGANEETVNILWSILTDVLPLGADLQFILWASPKIGEVLDSFEKERSGHGRVFEWLAKKRTEFLRKGAHQSLLKHDSFILRNFRCFISLSIPNKSVRDFSDELIALREAMISSLKSIQMPAVNLSVDEFISVITDLLHPTTSVNPTRSRWNPHDSLSLQMTDQEYFVRVFKDKLQFEGENETLEARALSVNEFPQSMALWKMADSIGPVFNTALQIPCPFVISLTIRLVDQESLGLVDAIKSASRKKDVEGADSGQKPTIFKEYGDKVFVNQRLAEGDRLVKTHFQVIFFSKEKEANQAERKIRDLYRVNGWKLKKTQYLQFQSFLAMLPMMMSEGMYSDMLFMGRLHTITAFNAANMMPIQAESKGTITPSLILPGRRGQIATFNPFDNTEGNYNVAIAAASGKGKSAFTQEYIIALLSAGGRVWVIDIGRSYEKTCNLIGGAFIEFSTAANISLNPFTHIRDFDTSLTLLKPLLAAMAHPSSRASDEELAFIEKALKAAWQEEKNQATITTVSNWLAKQSSAVCQNLSHLLYSFTSDGMYGRYFEGESNVDLSNQFVVLELQELKTKKDLQRIVMLVLMYHISEVMYLGERRQVKSCVIDEAWDLFGGDNEGAAQFIEAGYRTARRYNANFVTIVQSVNDYFKNSTTIAAFENSDTKIILGQTPEAIDQIKKSERLAMDAYQERLFKSLRKTDEYSECIIKTSSGISVHIIIFDPYSRTLITSKGPEVEAIKSWQKQGYALEEAIEIVAEKFKL
jgi:conjugal transfer ATP-binding protein TraC